MLGRFFGKDTGILPAFFNQILRGSCLECPYSQGYARSAKTRTLTQNALLGLSASSDTGPCSILRNTHRF